MMNCVVPKKVFLASAASAPRTGRLSAVLLCLLGLLTPGLGAASVFDGFAVYVNGERVSEVDCGSVPVGASVMCPEVELYWTVYDEQIDEITLKLRPEIETGGDEFEIVQLLDCPLNVTHSVGDLFCRIRVRYTPTEDGAHTGRIYYMAYISRRGSFAGVRHVFRGSVPGEERPGDDGGPGVVEPNPCVPDPSNNRYCLKLPL